MVSAILSDKVCENHSPDGTMAFSVKACAGYVVINADADTCSIRQFNVMYRGGKFYL